MVGDYFNHKEVLDVGGSPDALVYWIWPFPGIALSHEKALMEEKHDMLTINVLDTPSLSYEKSSPNSENFVASVWTLSWLMAFVWMKHSTAKSFLIKFDQVREA